MNRIILLFASMFLAGDAWAVFAISAGADASVNTQPYQYTFSASMDAAATHRWITVESCTGNCGEVNMSHREWEDSWETANAIKWCGGTTPSTCSSGGTVDGVCSESAEHGCPVYTTTNPRLGNYSWEAKNKALDPANPLANSNDNSAKHLSWSFQHAASGGYYEHWWWWPLGHDACWEPGPTNGVNHQNWCQVNQFKEANCSDCVTQTCIDNCKHNPTWTMTIFPDTFGNPTADEVYVFYTDQNTGGEDRCPDGVCLQELTPPFLPARDQWYHIQIYTSGHGTSEDVIVWIDGEIRYNKTGVSIGGDAPGPNIMWGVSAYGPDFLLNDSPSDPNAPFHDDVAVWSSSQVSNVTTSTLTFADTGVYTVRMWGSDGTITENDEIIITVGDDQDGDGVPDTSDNCLTISNASQLDADLDGYGCACDEDTTQDFIVGGEDFGPVLRTFGKPLGDCVDASKVTQSSGCTDHDDCAAGEFCSTPADVSCDNAVGAPDFGPILMNFGTSVGPSGLSCAGTAPCPGP